MTKSKNRLRKLKLIFSFAKPLWHNYVLITGLAFIISLTVLIQPWLMKFFLDEILIGKKFHLFWLVIITFVVVYFLDQALGLISSLLETKFYQRQQMIIKHRIYDHLQTLHMKFFQRIKTGDLLTRIDSDAIHIQSFIMTIVNTFFLNTFNLVVIFYICLKLNARVTLLALCVFPFYFLSEQILLRKLKKYSKKMRITDADIFSFLEESLSAVKSIKIFSREKDMSREYKRKMEKHNRLNYKFVIANDIGSAISGFIVYLPTLVILAYGGHQVLHGLLTIGSLIALRQYIEGLFGPIGAFVNLNRNLQLEMVSIDRVMTILQARSEQVDPPGAKVLRDCRGEIKFQHVKFAYAKGKPLLKDISGVIKPRQHIGLVGASGAGKSTLINLLFKFYEPLSGKIFLDGNDIEIIKTKSLRSKIGLVSQESIIFNKSIKENILFGNPKASMNEVIGAAKAAQIHDYICKLPKKYETIVGQQGCLLSAGERQRLSVARVILEDPDILILDEPSTYLDATTEELIRSALDYVSKGKTTITIAHRLATLKNIDQIWLLKDGKISEKGTFEELLSIKSDFYAYYITQFHGIELFKKQLKGEIERAKRQNKLLNLLKLEISNWADFDKDPIKGNELILKVLIELSSFLRDTYFSTDLPKARGTFMIALPDCDSKEVDKTAKSLTMRFAKEFPKIKLTISPESCDELKRCHEILNIE